VVVGVILKQNKMKASYKNGVFNFEIDGYAVELYKENEIWLDKVYTLFGHVINRISSEKSIKFSEVVDEMKKDIQESKQIEQTIFKN
jgi:cyclophilin family peptidyl-prolyl cis-trans isomerase